MLENKRLVSGSALSIQSERCKSQLGFNHPLSSVQAQGSCLIGIACVCFLASAVIVEERRPRRLRVRDDVDGEDVAGLQLKVLVRLLWRWEPFRPGVVVGRSFVVDRLCSAVEA